MTAAPPPVTTEELALFLDGEVAETRARDIRAQLETCAVSRRRLEALNAIRARLAQDDEQLEGVDLVAGIHHALARRQTQPPRRSWAFLFGLGGMAAAVCSLLLWVGRVPVPFTEDGFASKGGAVRLDARVGIQAFRSTGGRVEPLGRSMLRRDALMFSYTNAGPVAYAHLFILAVDRAGQVYWYHPALDADGGSAPALAIRAGASREELPDMVEHNLPAGPLAVYGVFAKAPMDTADVERAVAVLLDTRTWNAAEPRELPLEGTFQKVIPVEVQ